MQYRIPAAVVVGRQASGPRDEHPAPWRARREGKEPRNGAISMRIPLHRAALTAAEDLIDQVTLRLHAPLTVRPRGMARLRLLLADGAGPMYHAGRGSLTAELRGVLAAL